MLNKLNIKELVGENNIVETTYEAIELTIDQEGTELITQAEEI